MPSSRHSTDFDETKNALSCYRPPDKNAHLKLFFLFFKVYVMDSQNNRLNEQFF